MGANDRVRRRRGGPVKACAEKRRRRPGPRRSLNLSLCADHYRRIRGLAVLLDREPAELVMDWIEEKAAGMRFSLPGATEEEAEGPAGEGRGDRPEVPDVLPCRREVG